jgi:hypothetical protein
MIAEGCKSSTGKDLTPKMIGWIRCKHRIQAPKPPSGTLTVCQASERYGVTSGVVYYWIEHGVVRAQQRGTWPSRISCAATRLTISTGIAIPTPADAFEPDMIIVLTPTKRPEVSSKGPPEFPGLSGASVWIPPAPPHKFMAISGDT